VLLLLSVEHKNVFFVNFIDNLLLLRCRSRQEVYVTILLGEAKNALPELQLNSKDDDPYYHNKCYVETIACRPKICDKNQLFVEGSYNLMINDQ